MNILIVLPVTVPLLTAVLGLIFLRRIRLQQWLSHIGALVLLISSILLLRAVWQQGILSTQLGNWTAPFGITFVADLLSALMILITGFVAVCISLYASAAKETERIGFGLYPLIHFLLMGVSGAFLTGDYFNLYVWFEVMLMASFVLMVMGNRKSQLEGGFKYVTINIVSSVLFLAALGLLYGKTGTLNMADLSLKLSQDVNADVALTSAMLLMIAFGIKAGAFPLFFWLPASYHTPPPVISALFAGLLTKVGVYALIRSFTLVFTSDVGYTHSILLWVAGFTMVVGVFGAASQFHIRKILSFHTISQIGYMLLGLSLFTKAALSAAIFYMFHHFVVKMNLFLISGIVRKLKGSEELKKIGGLYKSNPWFAVIFLLPALSLAGIPPLSGFFAKFSLIKAGLENEQYWIVAVALAVGVFTLYSMTKIWAEAFWKKDPEKIKTATATHINLLMLLPVVFLVLLTMGIGVFPDLLFQVTDGAADQLFNPDLYIKAVFGETYAHFRQAP